MEIEELKKNLETGEIGDRFCDYDHGYICDIITEIADNAIDIYYSDLFEWAKDNFSIIEEANEELGTPTDITKQIQQGQFIYYERDLYDNLEDSILLCIYNYLQHDLKIEEITEEQNELIEEIDRNDNNARLEDILEEARKIVEGEDVENG